MICMVSCDAISRAMDHSKESTRQQQLTCLLITHMFWQDAATCFLK